MNSKFSSRVLSIVGILALGAVLASVGLAHATTPGLDLAMKVSEPTGLELIGLAFGGTMKLLQAKIAERTREVTAMKAITEAAAKRESTDLTAEERTTFDAHAAKVKELDGDIGRIQATLDAAREGTALELPGAGHIGASVDNLRDAPNHGFARGFGEFAVACLRVSVPGAQADERLQFSAASTAPGAYGNESSGADGGYLVPPEFSQSIVSTAYNEQDSFVPMTDQTPVTGNSMAFVTDESTPWGTTGIKSYWADEGAPGTESKGRNEPAVLRLKKLLALVPVTDELLSDSTALGSYITRKTPEAISFKTNQALWEGDGVGKPRGFFNAQALRVSVAKESGQAADTIVGMNVSKMRARMSATSWRRAIWQVNADCLPQLDSLAYGAALTNAQIYKPEGGQFGYGTLLGRPVMPTHFNETVGDLGDIALVDWGFYRTITKAGAGVETATSMHFWFDRGITAYRMSFRIDGQPAITKPVTPNKGANSLSPLVLLDARA